MIVIPHLTSDPYLPEVGEVYWVDTAILQGADKPFRPALVLWVPPSVTGRITVATRTSAAGAAGVPHPAAPELGLKKDGVFSRIRSAEARLWTPGNVRYLGLVDASLTAAVQREFRL